MSKHEPIRCFEGTAKPHEAFWKLINAADSQSGEPEIELYGIISEYSWMEDDITPKMFKADLARIGGGGPVTVRINSAGGDIVAASLMRAALTDYKGHITTRIDGLAASAAVVVAMAGDQVKIQDTAYMMIHDPAIVVMFAALDIALLGQLRDELKTIKQGIVDAYAAKTGLSVGRLSQMMAAETWMSAAEAVDLGFANEVIAGGKKPADRAYVNVLRNYANVPAALLMDEQEPEEAPSPQPSPEGEGDKSSDSRSETDPETPEAEPEGSQGEAGEPQQQAEPEGAVALRRRQLDLIEKSINQANPRIAKPGQPQEQPSQGDQP